MTTNCHEVCFCACSLVVIASDAFPAIEKTCAGELPFGCQQVFVRFIYIRITVFLYFGNQNTASFLFRNSAATTYEAGLGFGK